MDIIIWISFGVIAGIVANIISPQSSKGGMVGGVLLGISGSLLGGFLASVIFGVNPSGFSLNAFIVAIIGSMILLYIGKEVRSTNG